MGIKLPSYVVSAHSEWIIYFGSWLITRCFQDIEMEIILLVRYCVYSLFMEDGVSDFRFLSPSQLETVIHTCTFLESKTHAFKSEEIHQSPMHSSRHIFYGITRLQGDKICVLWCHQSWRFRCGILEYLFIFSFFIAAAEPIRWSEFPGNRESPQFTPHKIPTVIQMVQVQLPEIQRN